MSIAYGADPKPAKPWRVIPLPVQRAAILTPDGWVGGRFWDAVGPLQDGVAVVRETVSGKSGTTRRGGLIDAQGKSLTAPDVKFEDVLPYSEGLALVKVTGKYGFIDNKARIVIPAQWDDALGFQAGLCPVESNGKWGYIDRTGKVVINPSWDEARAFPDSDSLARVRDRDKWGYINRQGKMIVPIEYDVAWPFEGEVAFVQKDSTSNLWMLLGKNGMVIFREQWKLVRGFSVPENLAGVQTPSGLWGYIRPDGAYALRPQWENTWNFNNGFAVISKNGKLGVIDTMGRETVPPIWDHLRELAEGYAIAVRNEKEGYVEMATGRTIEPQWDHAYPVQDGFGLVSHDGHIGFVDLQKCQVLRWFEIPSPLADTPAGADNAKP